MMQSMIPCFLDSEVYARNKLRNNFHRQKFIELFCT